MATRSLVVPALLALAACAPEPTPRPDRPRPEPEVEVATTTEPSYPDVDPTSPDLLPDPVVSEHEVPGYEGDPSDELYDDTRIHQIDLTLSEDAVAALDSNPYSYTEADVVVDGVPVAGVGVRLRGKIGSFRVLDDKPKFKIDLNHYVAGQQVFGVETLSLNNAVADCSYLKEKLGFRVIAEAGIPVPRVTWSNVTVNGADYGLYVLVETQDDEFLDRNFVDSSGNLYDGKYKYRGGWDYTLLDFSADVHDLYQLEEGVDVYRADIHAITEALDVWQYQADFYAQLEPLVDWPYFHAYFAAEQYIEQWDGYAINKNNNRVYFNPALGGRLQFISTDLDNAFPISPWSNWQYPAGRLVSLCFADATCRAAHEAEVASFLDHIDTVDLQTDLAAWDLLTIDAALADPRRVCGSTVTDREALSGWIDTRTVDLRAFWGL